MSEHAHQTAFFDWLSAQGYRDYAYAIPNGGKRPGRSGHTLKQEGLTKGVFDVHVDMPTQCYPGFYIEFKYGKNTLSEEQKAFQISRTSRGFLCRIYYNWEEAAQDFKLYMSGHKFEEQLMSMPKTMRKGEKLLKKAEAKGSQGETKDIKKRITKEKKMDKMATKMGSKACYK